MPAYRSSFVRCDQCSYLFAQAEGAVPVCGPCLHKEAEALYRLHMSKGVPPCVFSEPPLEHDDFIGNLR